MHHTVEGWQHCRSSSSSSSPYCRGVAALQEWSDRFWVAVTGRGRGDGRSHSAQRQKQQERQWKTNSLAQNKYLGSHRVHRAAWAHVQRGNRGKKITFF